MLVSILFLAGVAASLSVPRFPQEHRIETSPEKLPALNLEQDTPANIPLGISETGELAVRDPGVLVARQFDSPHVWRRLVIGTASGVLTSAIWNFEWWFNEAPGLQGTITRGAFTASLNLADPFIRFTQLAAISKSANQYRGRAEMEFDGEVNGAAVVVKLVAEVFASAADCFVQSLIQPPTLTVGGQSVDVTSWTFDPVSN